MSAGVEGSKRLDVRPRTADGRCESTAPHGPDDPGTPEARNPEPERDARAENEAEEHDTPLLIDAHEDRWPWRKKIRGDPRKLFFYRIGVALLGALLLCLAAVTGPLPGPGGIPLAILGIAVWSSEFEWAQKLMIWFKAQLRRYLALPRSRRLLFWAIFGLCCATLGYLVLLVFGIPFWVPEFAANWLRHLPGV